MWEKIPGSLQCIYVPEQWSLRNCALTHLCLQLMKYIVKLQSKGAAVADELTMLFTGDLNPVAAKAQRKVPVPEG